MGASAGGCEWVCLGACAGGCEWVPPPAGVNGGSETAIVRVMKTAWIAGASGLVGSQLLALVLEDAQFALVASLGRRQLEIARPKLVQRVVDFAALDVGGLAPPDVAFCTLGTTIGKAGSERAFRAIDHDAVLAFAKAALAAGARCFVLVSSLGADPQSRIFYNRVKGETEADLRALGFESLPIARPSLLLGDRLESRPAERAMIVASRLLAGVLRPFASRPIEAQVVARALLVIARDPKPGVRSYSSGELQSLGSV
jgi:uncharacterized protein YbjT (DUF2867 family)